MPVRVGFVGCGGMAGGHIENWARMREQGEDVALTAFCDVDAARAERYATRFEGRAYTEFPEMLEREELEAVYVVVPPHAHTGAEIMAAQKGCALFVEKPIANSLATAREIAAAIVDRRISRVPIVRDGKLVGLVTRSDLVRAIPTHWKKPE